MRPEIESAFVEACRLNVFLIKQSSPETVEMPTEALRALLVARGLRANCHVGMSHEQMSPIQNVEWAIGQLVGVIDVQGWRYVNTALNIADYHIENFQRQVKA